MNSNLNMKPLLSLVGVLAGLAMAPAFSGEDCSVGADHGLGYPVFAGAAPTEVVVVNGVPNRTSILVHSSQSISPMPFGNGELCVAPFAPGHGRSDVAILDDEGSATFDLPPAGHFVQAWYRDVDGAGNLSNLFQIPAGL